MIYNNFYSLNPYILFLQIKINNPIQTRCKNNNHFNPMEQLKSDLQTTSSICTNYCELCHHSFSTKGNLKNHISTIHKNIRPFKCPYQNCDKSYSNKSRLDVHIRTHVHIHITNLDRGKAIRLFDMWEKLQREGKFKDTRRVPFLTKTL